MWDLISHCRFQGLAQESRSHGWRKREVREERGSGGDYEEENGGVRHGMEWLAILGTKAFGG